MFYINGEANFHEESNQDQKRVAVILGAKTAALTHKYLPYFFSLCPLTCKTKPAAQGCRNFSQLILLRSKSCSHGSLSKMANGDTPHI